MTSSSILRFGKYISETVSRSFVGKRNRPDIFISATSADLGTVRKIVKDALLDLDCFPVEQSHFSPDYRKVEEMLRAKISDCQAVIHIVGMRYGCEPRPANRPQGVPRRSYTQMEYYIANELGIRCYVFVCPEDFPYDESSVQEPHERQQLQGAHRQKFLDSNTIYTECKNRDQLKLDVLKLQKQLSEVELTVADNSLRRLWPVLLNWVVLLMVVGGLWWSIDKFAASTDSFLTELKEENERDRRQVLVIAEGMIEGVKTNLQALTPEIDPARLYAQAAAQFDGKNYADAFHLYAQLSDADPNNIEWHRRLEECAIQGNLTKPFMNRYVTLVQQYPTNAIFHNYLGNACLLIDKKDSDGKAREHYETAINLDPDLALPLANLAIIAFREGNIQKAENLFLRYLGAYPDDAQGWVNLGMLHVAETNDSHAASEAEKALRKAVSLDPSSAPAYKALGRLYATTDRKRESLQAFQRSLALDYDQPDVRKQVELGRWEAEDTDFSGGQSDDLRPRNFHSDPINTPPRVIAMKLFEEQRFQEAVDVCLAWIQQKPDNQLAFGLLGQAYDKLNKIAEAREAFGESKRLWENAKR